MPNNFSLSVDGLDRVIQAFEVLEGNVPQKIKQKLLLAADKTLKASQLTAPLDTGLLLATGRLEEGPAANSDSLAVDVTYGLPDSATPHTYSYPGSAVMSSLDADGYTWFTELGTSKMAPRPYLGPPFEEESQKLVTTIGDILGG